MASIAKGLFNQAKKLIGADVSKPSVSGEPDPAGPKRGKMTEALSIPARPTDAAGPASMDVDLPAGPSSHPAVPVQVDIKGPAAAGPTTLNTVARQLQRPARPVAPAAPLTDAQRAGDFLTTRVLGPSAGAPSWAVSSMALRPALARAHGELCEVLHAVVRDGTSASLLIMGESGVGKTLLVERALADVCAAHNTGGTGADKTVGVVRLSGLMHCEERTAFQEVARQLCGEFKQLFSAKATYDENLGFLRAMLASLHSCMKSVVFVLDDFDKFARSSGVSGGRAGRQMLLYNLLDVLQHSRVQAAVLGLTPAQDVMESLEKRVRSRFSHRKILLTPPLAFEPGKLLATATGAAAAAAARGGAPARKEEDSPVTYADTPLGILRDLLTLPTSALAVGSGVRELPWSAAYAEAHNKAVAAALQAPEVKDALHRLFFTSLTPASLAGIARTALAAWDADLAAAKGTGAGQVLLGTAHLKAGLEACGAEDLMAPLVADLSVLQLYLLTGMARLESKRVPMYNFEMVWEECRGIQEGRGLLSAFHRDAAWRAFEGLIATGVAFWVDQAIEARGRPLCYAGVSLRLTCDEVASGLQAHGGCPVELQRFLRMEA